MLIVDGFVHTLLQELAKGRIVRMGDLGSFQINVSGEGIDSSEIFSTKINSPSGERLKGDAANPYLRKNEAIADDSSIYLYFYYHSPLLMK